MYSSKNWSLKKLDSRFRGNDNYFDDIVTKDLVRRFRVRKVGALKKLAHFYLAQPASPMTFNAIEGKSISW